MTLDSHALLPPHGYSSRHHTHLPLRHRSTPPPPLPPTPPHPHPPSQERLLEAQERLYRRNLAKVRVFNEQLQDRVAADRQTLIAQAAHDAIDSQLADSQDFDYSQLHLPEQQRGKRQATPHAREYMPARPRANAASTLRPLTPGEPWAVATLTPAERRPGSAEAAAAAGEAEAAAHLAEWSAREAAVDAPTHKERLLSEIEQLMEKTAEALHGADLPFLGWDGPPTPPLQVPPPLSTEMLVDHLQGVFAQVAATTIQRRVRGYAGRAHARMEGEERIKRAQRASAVRIQAISRGRHVRADPRSFAARRAAERNTPQHSNDDPLTAEFMTIVDQLDPPTLDGGLAAEREDEGEMLGGLLPKLRAEVAQMKAQAEAQVAAQVAKVTASRPRTSAQAQAEAEQLTEAASRAEAAVEIDTLAQAEAAQQKVLHQQAQAALQQALSNPLLATGRTSPPAAGKASPPRQQTPPHCVRPSSAPVSDVDRLDSLIALQEGSSSRPRLLMRIPPHAPTHSQLAPFHYAHPTYTSLA